jgi:hypothetical protein
MRTAVSKLNYSLTNAVDSPSSLSLLAAVSSTVGRATVNGNDGPSDSSDSEMSSYCK